MATVQPNIFNMLVRAHLDDRLDEVAAAVIRSQADCECVLLFEVDRYADQVSLAAADCAESTDFDNVAAVIMPQILPVVEKTEPVAFSAELLGQLSEAHSAHQSMHSGFFIPLSIGAISELIITLWSPAKLSVEQLMPVLTSVLTVRAVFVADRDLETLAELALRLTQSLVPAEVAQQVIFSTMGHCGTGGGVMWWRVPGHEDRYTPVISVGMVPPELGSAEFSADDPVAQYIADPGQAVRTLDELFETAPPETARLLDGVRGGLIIGFFLQDSLAGFAVTAPHLGGAEFSARDIKYLSRLAPLAAVGLGNAWTHTWEKQVAGLQELLEFTKELTAGLDSLRVFSAIVNLPSKLIEFDRCALFVKGDDSYKLTAVSGIAGIPKKLSPELQQLHDFGSWLAAREQPAAYDRADERPVRDADAPITAYAKQEDLGSGYGLPLSDEEGTVGFLWWTSSKPGHFDRLRQEWCRLVANQSTTALRNVLLFRQVPLKSILMTLGEAKGRWRRRRRGRLRYILAAAAVVIACLIFIRAPLIVRGTCVVQPTWPIGVHAKASGWVEEVFTQEGDLVAEDQELARLSNPELIAQLEDLSGQLAVTERQRARLAHAGIAMGTRESALRWDQLRTRAEYLSRQKDDLLLRAPRGGRILTPNLPNLIGGWISAGDRFCELAVEDSFEVVTYVSVADAAYLHRGAIVSCLFDVGGVIEVHARVNQILAVSQDSLGKRMAVVRATLDETAPPLRIGLQGAAKIESAPRALGYVMFHRPWYWLKKLYWRYFGGI